MDLRPRKVDLLIGVLQIGVLQIGVLQIGVLLMGVLCAGCRPDAGEPSAPGKRMPLPDPRAAEYLVEAQQALYQGAVEVALALVDSAEHRAGSNSEAFLADVAFLRGRIQGELHHADEATRSYERVLELDPTYRGAWLNMGNLAFRGGEFREAVRFYRSEYELFGDPKVLVYIGHGYTELGQEDSARYEYERAIMQDDSLAEAYIRLAVLLENNGEPEEALSNARRAITLNPTDPDYRYILGHALLQNGDLEAAENELRRTIDQQPGHAEAHYSLGTVLSRLGKQDEAQRFLARVDSLNQIDESIDTFERRTRLYPDDPAAWVTYGYALHRAGRSSDAIRAFQVALYKGPATLDVHLLLANAYLTQHRLEDALVHYDAALQIDASVVGAWVNKGICLARMGSQEGAREAWESALRLDPDQPQASAYLADLPAPGE